MPPLLPTCASYADFKAISNDAFTPVIAHLRDQHRLPTVPFARFKHGSCFTFDAGDLVYKFYAPIFPEDFDRESRSLRFLKGRLPVPTPEVVAAGRLDDWDYVVMTRLRGETLEDLWPDLAEDERQRICRSAGELLATIHALEVPAELDVLNGSEGWRAFVDRQITSVVDRNRALGVAEPWLDQLSDFMGTWTPALRAMPRRTFLHTEVGQPHLLVRPGTLELTGLVDFEPSMVGNPGYDWPSIGLFLCPCDRPSFRAFADAHGAVPPAGEILAWHMVHQFGSLRQLFQRAGGCATSGRLEDIAEQVFGR